MSYILDALKKSESDRQLQNAPGIADVPVQSPRRALPAWIWLLSALLVINVVVLAGLLMRGNAQSPPVSVPTVQSEVALPPAPVVESAAEPAPATGPETSALPSQAGSESLALDAGTPVQAAPAPEPAAPAEITQSSAPRANRRTAAEPAAASPLPTLMELRANGRLQLPDLHLDVHVFSGSPQDRFVFINMSKYREQSRLAEGPLLTEIRQDGVVLEHQGRTFLLPRE